MSAKDKKKKKKKKPKGFIGKNISRVKTGTKVFNAGKNYVLPVIALAFVAFAAWIGVRPETDEK